MEGINWRKKAKGTKTAGYITHERRAQITWLRSESDTQQLKVDGLVVRVKEKRNAWHPKHDHECCLKT